MNGEILIKVWEINVCTCVCVCKNESTSVDEKDGKQED